MFHSHSGLFFNRLDGGSVQIIKTYDGRDVRSDNVVIDITLDATSWASVIASMSAEGETLEKYTEARAFHNLS